MDTKLTTQYTHYVITIFIITGAFFISNCAMLKVYFLFLVVLLLHWLTNGNECFISKLDHDGDSGAYSQGILKQFGIELSKNTVSVLNYLAILSLIWFTYRKLQRTCGFNLNSVF
jgi:hypothetical protein